MKVNIIYSPSVEPLTGFININPFVEEETDNVKMCDVRNLDLHVCDAEATEIVARDVADYIPLPEVTTVIDHWISKLRIGGKITISGVDAYVVSKAFAEYQMDIDTFNQLMLGPQTGPHEHKANVLTMTSITNYLEQLHGLKVVHKRYDEYSYIVTAQRVK